MEYRIPYEVEAETAYAAIIAASALLRTGVEVRKVRSVSPTVPGWYEVVLEVTERTPDHAPDATVESEYAL